MNEPTVDRDPFEVVAELFLARYRAGERPGVEEYAARHPELADQIRSALAGAGDGRGGFVAQPRLGPAWRANSDPAGQCPRDPGQLDRLGAQSRASRHGSRPDRFRHDQSRVRRDALARRTGRPLPALRRDRPRRHGRRPPGTRPRPGPRPGRQGLARKPRRQAGDAAPVRGGSADRRPVAASRHRAGVRVGRLRRPPALFHHEARERAHPRGAPERKDDGSPAFILLSRAPPLPVHFRGRMPDRGLLAFPGRDPPRPEARQRHGRQLRRGAGDGLGPGEGPEGSEPRRWDPDPARRRGEPGRDGAERFGRGRVASRQRPGHTSVHGA